MYADPSLIRKHSIKLRFSADEKKIIEAAADKAGMQVAEFCRVVAIDRLEKMRVDMDQVS